MKTFTVCFMVTGGITVSAPSREAALAYAGSEQGMEEIGLCLSGNEVTFTEVIEEE